MRPSYKILAVITASFVLYILPAAGSRGGFSFSDGVAERVRQLKERSPKITKWHGYAADEFRAFASAGAHLKSLQLFCESEGRMPTGSVILYRGTSPLAQGDLVGLTDDLERLAPAINDMPEVLRYQRFADSAADESRKFSYEGGLARLWPSASRWKEGVASPNFYTCAPNLSGKAGVPESLAAVSGLANAATGTDATGFSWSMSINGDRADAYMLKAMAAGPSDEDAVLRRYAQLKQELERNGPPRQMTEVLAVSANGEELLLLGNRTYEFADKGAVTLVLARSTGPAALYVTFSARSPYLQAGKRS